MRFRRKKRRGICKGADDQDGYDISGKKIALFATSGGGGIGKTAEKLMAYLPEDARIVDAKGFKGTVTADEMREWAGRKVMV